MLGRIYAIALNTFREAIRNRVLYGIIVFVIAINLFTLLLKEMSYRESERVVKDTGLAAMSFFGSITAVFLGVSLLYTELKKRTVHTILAKPVGRAEFVIGKYLGMVGTLMLLSVIFALSLALVVKLSGLEWNVILLKAAVLFTFEIIVVAAIATFFSAFASPFLSGIFTLGVWFLGRVTLEMRTALETQELSGVIEALLNAGLLLIPDMYVFSPSSRTIDGEHWTIHGQFVTWGYVGSAGVYAAFCILISLVLATVIFSRRDFT